MTRREQVDQMLGQVCFVNDEYEVHVKMEADGLHIYALRVLNGNTELPRGFIRGDNSMFFPKRKDQ